MTLLTEQDKRELTINVVHDEAPPPDTSENPTDVIYDLKEIVREESDYQINPAVAERWIRNELSKMGFFDDD